MIRTSHNFCAILMALCLSSTLAFADPGDIYKTDNAIWASAGGMYYNYKEQIGAPNLPDSERGWIPSVAGGISYLGYSNLYLSLETSLTYGDADYNGAFLFFPTTAVQGETRETISETDAKLGEAFALNSNLVFIPYAEVGFRYWDRDLGGGQTEDYRNFDVLGGVMLQGALANDLVLTGYGAAGTTFAAQVEADPDTFDLGNSGIYKLGGKINYGLTEDLDIFTAADYQYFQYKESDVSGSGFFEPTSHTGETSVRLGLAYRY